MDATASVVPLRDQPAIEVAGLRKSYSGGVEAVRGIDFQVETGEVFGLLGPNGAGKSTTIGILTTTVGATAGTARLAGFDVGTHPLSARLVSSVVFQEPVVDRALTGRRNLEIHGRLWGAITAATMSRIDEIVAGFGLSEIVDRPVAGYSGGERRRLEIARALVSSPRILFLDEPTVGLDPRIRYELLDRISGLRGREDMTILLTTHYLEEAQSLCDRIAVIHRGRIVAMDTPKGLVEALGSQVIELGVDGDPWRTLAALQQHGLADEDAFVVGSSISIPVRGTTADDAIANIDLLSLPITSRSARKPTLDDVYLQLTGDRIVDAA